MMSLTVGEIAQLSHGVLSHVADPTARVTGPVVVDSRRVTRGCLFVAVSGARVDGHDFAAQAVADGAPVVLASRPVSVPAVVVGDTVRALGDLARGYLHRLASPVVVGITGSSGKTSTKDIVGQLLDQTRADGRARGIVQHRGRAASHRAAGRPDTRVPRPRIQRTRTRSHRLPLRDCSAADRRRAQRRRRASRRVRQPDRGSAGQG